MAGSKAESFQRPTRSEIRRRQRRRRRLRYGALAGSVAAFLGTAALAVSLDSSTPHVLPSPSPSASWCGNDTLGTIHTFGNARMHSFGELAQQQGQDFEQSVTIDHPEQNIIFQS